MLVPSKQAVEGSNPSAFTLKPTEFSGFFCFYTFRIFYFPTFTEIKRAILRENHIFFTTQYLEIW